MSDLSDPTALPTEPGHYLDKDGGYWCITEDGSLFDPADLETQTNGDPTQYAPFTRLFPAAHFATEHERLKLDLATVEATAESQASELDGLRAQIEKAPHAMHCEYHIWETYPIEVGEPPACSCWKSKSPRGTVARIQADALTAVDARIQRQMDAEEKKEPTPSSTGHWSGLAEAQQLLRAALREGAGQ